jgi:hypothetical protein
LQVSSLLRRLARKRLIGKTRELIAEWLGMRHAFERQRALFEPPLGRRTGIKGRDTTDESKARIGRCIDELEALLKVHDG